MNTKCVVCGREANPDLIIVEKDFEISICSHNCGIQYLQRLFRQGRIAWLKERNVETPITMTWEEVSE